MRVYVNYRNVDKYALSQSYCTLFSIWHILSAIIIIPLYEKWKYLAKFHHAFVVKREHRQSTDAIAYRETQIFARMMNSRAAVSLILFEPSIMRMCVLLILLSHRGRESRRVKGNSQPGRYSLSDIVRSESLICTVRILMDPDILCPAQVIPVGFKGTAWRVGAHNETTPRSHRQSKPRDRSSLWGEIKSIFVALSAALALPSRSPSPRYVAPDIAITRCDWFLSRSLSRRRTLYHYVQTRNFAIEIRCRGAASIKS